MPSESLADLNQKDWICACRKLGLLVETKHGKGSHVLVKHASEARKLTIQYELYKVINQKIFGKLKQWGFSEEQIFEALR